MFHILIVVLLSLTESVHPDHRQLFEQEPSSALASTHDQGGRS